MGLPRFIWGISHKECKGDNIMKTEYMNNNIEVRQAIEKKRLRYFEVAQELGINPCTFSMWLRVELSPERKAQVLKAIKSIKY